MAHESYYYIKEIVTGAPNYTQHQNSAHSKNSPIDCDEVMLTNIQWHMVAISKLRYRKYWAIQVKVHLKPDKKQLHYQIIQYTGMATPTCGMYVF